VNESERDLLQGEDGQDNSENRLGNRQNVKLVHERVREAILSGEIPAETILSQVQLAEQFGISRIPLREALRLLEREGLVESEINRRVRVAPFSVTDLEQLYAMRIQLEALGIRLTVPLLTQENLAELEELLTRMGGFARAEDYEGWEVPHRAFHAALVAHAGDRLEGMISQLYDHAERYRRAFMLETARAWDKSMAEHRELLEICKGGDPTAAAERLARHYSVTALSLIAALAPEHEPLAVRTALQMAMRA
jgi:DNA-binding GntR family transcriptional regulator